MCVITKDNNTLDGLRALALFSGRFYKDNQNTEPPLKHAVLPIAPSRANPSP